MNAHDVNCTYGYHRNMVGLRTTGFRVAIAAACAATAVAIFLPGNQAARTMLALAGAAAWLTTWAWHQLGPRHARQAATSYAEAFLGAILANPEVSGSGPASTSSQATG